MDPRLVLFYAYDGCVLLDLAGPREAFSIARHLVAPDARGYELRTVGPTNQVTTFCGQRILTDPMPTRTKVDTLLVAGGAALDGVIASGPAVRDVARLGERARRIASVCSGALLLAEAGFLRGRRATTHWAMSGQLASYESVVVEPDRIHVQDGPVWTSAGVTAGIDLALALIEDDHGREVARQVASWLVVYLRRSGGQSQFSVPLHATTAASDSLREVLTHVEAHPDADLTVPALARRMSLSERQFLRVFKAEVGMTPGHYVDRARLAAAQRMLEQTDRTVEVVARATGLGNAATLHRSFQRHLHTSPGAYRRHFHRKAG